MHDHIDHLVLAVSDLNSARSQISQLLGVCPAFGGRHPGWGTWNALISLGDSTYLELIAPDPESEGTEFHRPEIFSTPGQARMIGWFAKCSRLTSARDSLQSAGICLGEIRQGSRMLPDGRTLSWQLTDPEVMVCDGIFPMLIDWADSPHPALSAPSGCRLLEFNLVHPMASEVSAHLNVIGIEQNVQEGSQPSISTVLETPNGIVRLP